MLFSFLQIFELLSQLVDLFCCIELTLIGHEVILYFFEVVSLSLVATVQQARAFVLVTLNSHAVESIRHIDDFLRCFSVVTHEVSAEDHLHSWLKFGFKIYQVDS